MDCAALSYSHTALSFSNHFLFSGQLVVVQTVVLPHAVFASITNLLQIWLYKTGEGLITIWPSCKSLLIDPQELN